MGIKVMSHVWEHSTVKGNDLLMLLAIADHAGDDNGIAYPGVSRLAKKVRVGHRSAQKIIRRLQDEGELFVDTCAGLKTKHGHTNQYHLLNYRKSIGITDEHHNTPENVGVNSGTPVGVNSGTPVGVNSGTPVGVNSGTPKPSVEPSVEPSVVTPIGVTKPQTPFVELVESDKIIALIHAWVEQREEYGTPVAGKPFANRTIRAGAKQLITLGLEPRHVKAYTKHLQDNDGWYQEHAVDFKKIIETCKLWVDKVLREHNEKQAQTPRQVDPPPREIITQWIDDGCNRQDMLNMMVASGVPQTQANSTLDQYGVIA